MSHDTEARLSAALHDVVGDQPFTPDLDRIEARGRKLRHRRTALVATGAGAFAVAAVAAVAVTVSGGGVQAPAPTVAGPEPVPSATSATATTSRAPLLKLAGYLTTAEAPAGDATLILRHQVYVGGPTVDDHDLYADNGDYFYAHTRGGLPKQVRGHHTSGGNLFRREVAAAKYAAKGDLKKARKLMASAPSPSTEMTDIGPGVVPDATAYSNLGSDVQQGAEVNLTDNWIWGDSLDALEAGVGDPKVRAGVLRLLADMPEVAIVGGTEAGQPTLTLTAGKPALTGDMVQSLTINAKTGVPVKFTDNAGTTITYTVTRVRLADVAKGKF